MENPLVLDIVPSSACGFILLNSPLRPFLDLLVHNAASIPSVQFKYNSSNPYQTDIIVHLPRNGIVVYVDSTTQRIKSVSIYDPSKCILLYRGKEFNSERVTPTLVTVYRTFGPTYAGTVDKKRCEYHLTYPGVKFTFPIPPKHISLVSSKDLPLEFPDGTTPVLSTIDISLDSTTPSPTISTPSLPDLHSPSFYPYYYEQVIIRPQKSVTFTQRSITLHFKVTTPQDVRHYFGPPSTIYYKALTSPSATSPHSGSSPASASAAPESILIHNKLPKSNDYFYNYYDLGIDMQFCSKLHTLKKLVVHCNVPGCYEFHRYSMCNFSILVDDEVKSDGSPVSITPSTTLSQLKSLLGEPTDPPVVFSRDLCLTHPTSASSDSANLKSDASLNSISNSDAKSEKNHKNHKSNKPKSGKASKSDKNNIKTNSQLPSSSSLIWGFKNGIYKVTKAGIIESVTVF
ncbi:hypothetical protein BKA69DRAFT_330427 [Paraphysoderma sedebokerense]|nr:hypothetical protein BKA69DRAFT_330427 [Paraphysoderma sedebokerense]